MRPAALVVAAALAATAASGQPLELEVLFEPESATVGDLVTATLTLRNAPDDPARTPRFPDWSGGWGEVEAREVSPPERIAAPDGAIWRQTLRLAAFRTGTLPLPPVAVAIPGEPPTGVATPAGLALEIRSVLPDDPQAATPRPPAPPRRLELPATFGWTATALAAAALALLVLLRRRRQRSATTTDGARLSPYDELARALDAVDPSPADAAHAAVSLALRRYLGRAFAMPAAQSSTSELGRRLGRRGLEPELVRRIVRLLREIDQVKFARAAAPRERLAPRLAEAREVARAVELHLRPPAAEEAA